ncbi:MAG: glycosyltransferase [Cyanothece sp. SIO2G6]|nr:glycosyltransferase [Cyanothece sp. SIO2G6]
MLHFFWGGYSMTENSLEVYEYSNSEIPKWAEYYLSQKTGFNQTSWRSGQVTEGPNDILIGHPTWDGRNSYLKEIMGALNHNWVRDNGLVSGDTCHPNTYILMPWIPEFPIEWTSQMPFYKEQLKAAHKIFALCGSFWFEKAMQKDDDSIQSQMKHKLVHCNMGIASQNFNVVKQSFNEIGERQILHMSHLGSYKGFDVTCKSLLGIETLLHVASSALTGDAGLRSLLVDNEEFFFNFLGFVNNNDPEFNHWVVENCDFYIHTATMDAQATTILESCARGLVPLVTPESGLTSPHAIYLTHDPAENHKIIEWALQLPESELKKRSELVREQMVRENSWKDIFETIWSGIQQDIQERSVSHV